MDAADLAARFDEISLESSLYTSRKDEPQAVATGTCLFCEEPIIDDEEDDIPRRWCDAACRDDWEKDNG